MALSEGDRKMTPKVKGTLMVVLLVLLAAVPPIAPPPPQHIPGLFTSTDYPPGAMALGEQGAVYFQLVINPQGRVDSCSILLSSGFKDLDEATCRLATSRARFSPATDDDDKPIYGTYRMTTVWRIPGYRPPPPQSTPPDLDLTINAAPMGVRLPLELGLSYRVKADGTASHCQLSGNAKPAPKELVDLACNAVMQSPVEITRNRDNVPVDASETATVRFSTDKRTQ